MLEPDIVLTEDITLHCVRRL